MLTPLLLSIVAFQGEPATQFTLLPKGAMAKIGYYPPMRAEMSAAQPPTIRKAPAGLAAPLYGSLPFGGQSCAFVLDEPEGKPARLFVDTNGNGDLTDDPSCEWTAKTDAGKDGKPSTMYNGSAQLNLGSAEKPLLVSLSVYRFDKNDPARERLKTTLLYYRDYAWEGELALGAKRCKALLVDEQCRGDFRPAQSEDPKAGPSVTLLIDANGNGKFDTRGESFDVRKPFNIGGTTWELADIARDGSTFRLLKSTQHVDEIPTPPDHSVGKKITAFEAKDTEGKPLAFPVDYKGKVVLLDFWATWCGPCMKEMPNVVAAYAKYHEQGFEVLGVSLDDDKTIAKMPEVMKGAGMVWRQIADAKSWTGALPSLYAISSIPATFLVDGTTGEVLGSNLRGPALDEALAKALAKKSGK
jgi:thiol-disulfide isomerase/thioredoxin